MNDGLIPQRYARALYKYATEKGNADKVYDEMKNVVEAFDSNPTLCKAVRNPFVSRDDKMQLLVSAAGDAAEPDYKEFIRLLLDNHREEYARLAALAYRDIYRREHNISQVEIVTCTQLPAEETDKLLNMVKKSFPEAKLEVRYRIDPELIGGFVVNVDSVSMNASISNEIEQLRQKLLSNN